MGTYNWKKPGIVRGRWKDKAMKDRDMTARARAAYEWLMENNATYAHWQRKHEDATLKGPDAAHGYVFHTWNLLLHSPGVEVAAFPLLYPQPSFGDTDVRERLMELSWISDTAKPSIGFSYMKKVTSPCLSYAQEATLLFLLHDVQLAKSIEQKLRMAENRTLHRTY